MCRVWSAAGCAAALWLCADWLHRDLISYEESGSQHKKVKLHSVQSASVAAAACVVQQLEADHAPPLLQRD